MAIWLRNSHTGEKVAPCTINLESYECADDEVAIKNYSECEGMLDCLHEAALIHQPHNFVNSGWVEVPICKLTPLAIELRDKSFNK